jgi:hypothetical protein
MPKFQPSTPGPKPSPIPHAEWIPLSKGHYALIDAADYEWLSGWRWTWRPSGSIRTGSGYAFRTRSAAERTRGVFPVSVQMHREIMNVTAQPNVQVDHINHDGLDNRRSNLRLATGSQQLQNARKRNGTSSSYKGVYLFRQRKNRGKAYTWTRWTAMIKANGKKISLGYFESEEDAARAYNEAAKRYFGEFAHLNEIPSSSQRPQREASEASGPS